MPYRANGIPMPQLVIVPVTFTDNGLPVPAPFFDGGTPSPPGPISAMPPQPPLLTSSTINGRSTVDRTSADVPGLDAATSRCPISTDDAYGVTPGG